MFRRGPRRLSGGNPMVYLIALQAIGQFLQLQRKPPVTAAVIAANVAIYMRPGPLDVILPGVSSVCLNPRLFLETLDLKRLVLSAVYHADEVHLIYNMVSFLWKGLQLEFQLGSEAFALTLAQLLLLSQTSMVLISKLLATFTSWTAPFNNECAIGFSAVVFALKTVLNASDPSFSSVAGLLLPTRYMAWAELVLIQYMVPNASFVGHLSGILAGLIYLHLPRVAGSAGGAIGGVLGALRLPFSHLRQSWQRRGRFSGRSRVTGQGSGPNQHQSSVHVQGEGPVVRRCSVCTYDCHDALSACEMCGTLWSTDGSSSENQNKNPPSGWAGRPDLWAPETGSGSNSQSQAASGYVNGDEFLSVDELRRRRLNRFAR